MKHRTARDCTVEAFEDWAAATDRVEAVGQAADEEGGPSLSLVPPTLRGEPAQTAAALQCAPPDEAAEKPVLQRIPYVLVAACAGLRFAHAAATSPPPAARRGAAAARARFALRTEVHEKRGRS